MTAVPARSWPGRYIDALGKPAYLYRSSVDEATDLARLIGDEGEPDRLDLPPFVCARARAKGIAIASAADREWGDHIGPDLRW